MASRRPLELGGPGLELADLTAILEIVAGGCLATAFTWVQHHGVLAALSASPNTALRDDLVPALVAGRTRGGVAFAGAVPVPPRMRAERVAARLAVVRSRPIRQRLGHHRRAAGLRGRRRLG